MITKYIGLDAHSSTCTFCVMDPQGVVLENKTIATNGRLLVDYVRSLGGNLVIAFEECDLSCWLFDILQKHVNKIVVCNPVHNAQYKRKKTDKIDAWSLADLLRGGYLKPVFHDGSSREKFRMLVSGYDDTVEESTRLQNRIKAIKRRIQSNEKAFSAGDPEFILSQFSVRLDQLKQMKTEYENKLTDEVKKFKESKYLISIPGIAYIQTAKIISHVVDPTRFKNKHKFYSYSDLTRHRRTSGNRQYGSVRSYGDRTLKCVFKMAAHAALKGTGCLRLYYDALRNKGLGDKDARNAVSRKIAAVTLAVWRNKKYFNEQMILKSLPVKV
jgi:transposase